MRSTETCFLRSTSMDFRSGRSRTEMVARARQSNRCCRVLENDCASCCARISRRRSRELAMNRPNSTNNGDDDEEMRGWLVEAGDPGVEPRLEHVEQLRSLLLDRV